MSVDRSTRNALAAILLIAALFVAMNRVVESASFVDWWLPLVLLVLGLLLVFPPNLSRPHLEEDEEEARPALPASGVQTYLASGAQPTPRLHTMTIRPDPDLAQYDTTVSAAESDVLPFTEPSDVPTEVVAEGPSQKIPLERGSVDEQPAPEVKFTARSEAAEPDTDVAEDGSPRCATLRPECHRN